jgi:hypothetical protein
MTLTQRVIQWTTILCVFADLCVFARNACLPSSGFAQEPKIAKTQRTAFHLIFVDFFYTKLNARIFAPNQTSGQRSATPEHRCSNIRFTKRAISSTATSGRLPRL